MLELIVGAVFTACMGTSSGHDVPLFKQFQKHWELIDKKKFEDACTDEYVAKTIADVNDDISLFIFAQLQNNQPRDDYREILWFFLVESLPQGLDSWLLDQCTIPGECTR